MREQRRFSYRHELEDNERREGGKAEEHRADEESPKSGAGRRGRRLSGRR